LSSSTKPPARGVKLAFLLALTGFLLCDAAALLALGNLIGFWSIRYNTLLTVLAGGIGCFIAGVLYRRLFPN
jgi:hypothetical protein